MKASTKNLPVEFTSTPTQKQIDNAELMGWEYLGDGYFAKGELMGYYTNHGFKVE